MSGSLEFSWFIYDSSSDAMYCDDCRKAGPDIAGKTEFVNKFVFAYYYCLVCVSLEHETS